MTKRLLMLLVLAYPIVRQEVHAGHKETRREQARKIERSYKNNSSETQRDVADRITIDGDRAIARGDARGAKEAEAASNKARDAKTADQARQIEKIYNKDNFN